MLLAGCAGVIIEPSSTAAASGPTKFWGYALQPNQLMRLEAQQVGGTWVEVARGNAVVRPTYAATRTGFYWALVADPTTAASAYRRYGTDGYTVFYRVTSPDLSPAETHNAGTNNGGPTGTDFADVWAREKTDGIVRLTVH